MITALSAIIWQSLSGNCEKNSILDGYLKLMYPNGEFTKEELEKVIQIALEMRRRVKEQLKKLSGGKLIPNGMCNP